MISKGADTDQRFFQMKVDMMSLGEGLRWTRVAVSLQKISRIIKKFRKRQYRIRYRVKTYHIFFFIVRQHIQYRIVKTYVKVIDCTREIFCTILFS